MQEIDRLAEFKRWLAQGAANPAAIQNLDLTAFSDRIHALRFDESLFLGCTLEPTAAGHIVESGGLVLRDIVQFHFQIHRSKLYRVEELFAGYKPSASGGYKATRDYRVYEQYVQQGKDRPASIRVSLARRLHDHSITDALAEVIAGRKVVAVMGGHGMERRDPFYKKVALLSRRLTRRGFLMVSGGGPGAMEATHLGAYFAYRGEDELTAAIEGIGVRPAGAEPGKEYADPDWLDRAWKVRETYPLNAADADKSMSIGVPTWLYGHEPPAPFATHIAKYFANSVREDGLLAIATHGVVFAPGSAGTTQEIFQDATQNHYGSVGVYSPMILFGVEHWTVKRPVWPLLQHVSRGRTYGELVALTDSEDEIERRLCTFDPQVYRAR